MNTHSLDNDGSLHYPSLLQLLLGLFYDGKTDDTVDSIAAFGCGGTLQGTNKQLHLHTIDAHVIPYDRPMIGSITR